MIALSQFNSLSKDEAAGLLALAWRSRPGARRW
ncbi:2-oxo-4-hydroxy-4-carboxy-5-ureidoimidazoline (OHCU) decarboxylase [Klebsiella pneumoniae]|uniref:2-oxo-4-hydroxy-4-carboxy-5-ureidoimidazoline (OHCU) decarboxylase n=1 Tax=Klebsiella pneumoniae TaxID=573 RepID=A0A377W1V9_KLEPN|nr:2-oxo-4-hydroxy-4-carboxy-5-ureidoimidazoline (OHCU) decarboxylase [Klebsiella pneumoniae]